MRSANARRFGVLAITGMWVLLAASAAVGSVHLAGGGRSIVPLFHHPLALAPGVHHSVANSSSTNWAGYAALGASGSVTLVAGSWIVPTIQGSCPSKYEYSSFWVGIDGYSSSTVEQTGTDSDCQGGVATYYAWYEFYPNPSHLFSTLTIHPGDKISATVKYASGHFQAKLTDLTTGKSAKHNSTISASRSSAEWIAEAPSSSSGVLPLADFGTVDFGHGYTNVTGTNDATIGGVKAAIGSFSTVYSIKMVNNANTADKAVTTSLTGSGTSFTCVWKSAGP